jgi:hypothetical protein
MGNKVHKLRMAKATLEDIDKTRDFLQILEQLFDNRWFCSHDAQWEDWDDEDENKQEIFRIRKRLAFEEGLSESDVDNGLILFEFIKQKYREIDCHWNRVLGNVDVLIYNACDPQQDTVEWHPYIERALENSILGE